MKGHARCKRDTGLGTTPQSSLWPQMGNSACALTNPFSPTGQLRSLTSCISSLILKNGVRAIILYFQCMKFVNPSPADSAGITCMQHLCPMERQGDIFSSVACRIVWSLLFSKSSFFASVQNILQGKIAPRGLASCDLIISENPLHRSSLKYRQWPDPYWSPHLSPD